MSSLPPGERIDGIDAPLPPGEHVRWQGSPAWRALAWRAFHGRTVVAYFGLLTLWQLGAAAVGSKSIQAALGTIVLLTAMAIISLGCSALLAWVTAKHALYAITDRRVVLRIGAIVPSIINIPFRMVDAVAVKRYGKDLGDLAIGLTGTDRIAFFQLWPHVRPWRVTQPHPMLRAIAEPLVVGQILRDAAAAANEPGTFTATELASTANPSAVASSHHTRAPAVAL